MASQAKSRITPPPSVPLPEAKITAAQTLQDINCEATLTRHALTAWWDRWEERSRSAIFQSSLCHNVTITVDRVPSNAKFRSRA